MHANFFTSKEILPFYILFAMIIAIIIINYFRGPKEFWSPLTIIAIIYGYYCLIGPYEAVTTGATMDRLQDMRRFYPSALWGALVSLIAYAIGFFFHGKGNRSRKLEPRFSIEVLNDYGKKIFIAGFILFSLSRGGNITGLVNPLDAEYVERTGGSFSNYLSLSLNFLIPGITMLFLYFMVTKKGLWWFVIPLLLALGIFTTLGFRYRIVLLLGSMATVYYLIKGKRPNLILASVGIIALIAVMGIIGKSRQYGRGLNVKRLEGVTTESAYQSGLQEAMIFQTSGAVIDMVPSRHPYAGFQPIISTLLFPIPSSLLEGKNSADYLFDMMDAIYSKKYSEGAAIMAYGEYYLAFGWAGIILGCAIIGWFLRKLWNWFLANSNNPLVMAAYAVSVIYLYVAISRGYLPQVTNLFFFTVFPIYVVLRVVRKKYNNVARSWKSA